LSKIRVVLADDHKILRQGLRSLLEEEEDIEVVGEASDGEEALKTIYAESPDIVVMDIGMPKVNGLEAAAQLKKKKTRTSVIILSMFDDRTHVRRAVDVGARGYLVKQTAAEDLITAIREVNRGNAFFSPSIVGILIERKTVTPKYKRISDLTSRDVEVLKLVALGKTTPEISSELCISVKTVGKHRQQTMDKLGIHDIAGLTRYAISKNLIGVVDEKPAESKTPG